MNITIFGNPPVTPEALVEVRKQIEILCIKKGVTSSIMVGWEVMRPWKNCVFVFYHGDALCAVRAPLAEDLL